MQGTDFLLNYLTRKVRNLNKRMYFKQKTVVYIFKCNLLFTFVLGYLSYAHMRLALQVFIGKRINCIIICYNIS